MATEKETVILDFEVDTKEAVVSIDNLTKANKALKDERKNLNLETDAGVKRLVEINTEISKNETVIKSTTKAVKDNSSELKLNSNSLEGLAKANKELLAERNKIDTSTESGTKRIKEINSQLDKNNKTIKDNSDALGKQRLNIGNYASAIDKLIPGFDGLSQAVGGSKTFIIGASESFKTMGLATKLALGPIALIITAITLLVSWLTRTEAGGDLLAKTIDQLQAILGVVLDRITAVGGAIAKLFTGDIIGAWEDAKKAVSGIGDEMARELKIAGELADALDELEDRERNQKVALSESTLEIKRLIIESKNRNLTEQQKIDILQKATDLEIKSNDISKQIALDKLKAATKQIELDFSQYGITKKKTESEVEYAKRIVADANLTGAARDKVSDAVIALNEVEGQSLVIQEKISNQIDAQNEKQKAKIEKLKELQDKEFEKYQKDIEQNEKLKESNDDLYESTLDKLNKINEKDKEVSTNKQINYARDLVVALKAWDDTVAANKSASNKVIAQQEAENAARIASIVDTGNQIVGLTDQLANSLFAARDNYFKLQENQLAVSLANQKTQLNQQYTDDLAALDAKYAAGELSKDEYDKQVLLLNQTNQAAIKKAEIDQAKALNEVKKKEFEANKKNRIASAIADAAKAVLSTFAAAAGGLILKGIAAAAAGVFAAIHVAQIKKEEFVPTTFRTGGYTGDGNPNELAGSVHKSEFVMPSEVVSRYGKEHFQSYMDGSIVANGSGAGAQSQGSMSSAPVYLDYTEFRKFVREIELKESIVRK